MNDIARHISLDAASDAQLVCMAKVGNDGALTLLIRRYAPLVRMRAKSFTKGTLDEDDLFQEGMIALLKAVRGYREDVTGSFKTFAAVCINNKLRNAVTSHMRNKNAPMRAYLSLSEVGAAEKHFAADMTQTPEQFVIAGEETDARRQKIQTLLSPFEQQVLKLYLSSFSYEEMANQLESTAKAVDNALQRVRRKLRSVFTNE